MHDAVFMKRTQRGGERERERGVRYLSRRRERGKPEREEHADTEAIYTRREIINSNNTAARGTTHPVVVG